MEEQQLFDVTKPFIVEIQSGGIRRAELKYPTDPQWIARTHAQKIIRTDIGRNKSKSTSTPIEAHDMRLFEDRLIGESSQPFDEYEASLAIDRLARADVASSEVTGDTVTVHLTVFGGAETEYVFRMPRRKQIVEFGRAAVSVTATAKGAETALSLEPSARLYDDLIISATGYEADTAVPIVHKDAAVTEVVRLQSPEA